MLRILMKRWSMRSLSLEESNKWARKLHHLGHNKVKPSRVTKILRWKKKILLLLSKFYRIYGIGPNLWYGLVQHANEWTNKRTNQNFTINLSILYLLIVLAGKQKVICLCGCISCKLIAFCVGRDSNAQTHSELECHKIGLMVIIFIFKYNIVVFLIEFGDFRPLLSIWNGVHF